MNAEEAVSRLSTHGAHLDDKYVVSCGTTALLTIQKIFCTQEHRDLTWEYWYQLTAPSCTVDSVANQRHSHALPRPVHGAQPKPSLLRLHTSRHSYHVNCLTCRLDGVLLSEPFMYKYVVDRAQACAVLIPDTCVCLSLLAFPACPTIPPE